MHADPFPEGGAAYRLGVWLAEPYDPIQMHTAGSVFRLILAAGSSDI